MATNKLTDLKIKAKLRETKQHAAEGSAKNALLGDGQGLYLSISKTGTGSWLYRYMDEGKAKAVGLGGYPDTSLQTAREKAQALRTARAGGQNIEPSRGPAHIERSRQSEHLPSSFEEAATAYMQVASPSWKNRKHAQQWQNTLAQYAYPVIGKMRLNDIETKHLQQILTPIWRDKTETAARLRGRIETILDWAGAMKMRQGENPARLKGNLEYLLPKKNSTEREHHPALPYREMPKFYAKLQAQRGMARYALEFLILCASRTGEVIGAKWEEIDLQRGLWTIPKGRMKAGIEHRVPLSERALQVLTEVKPFSGEVYVFNSRSREKPLSNMAMSMMLRRMGYQTITVHGMRSSFRVWAGEETSYPYEICEQALAHRLPDTVAAAYLRTDFYDKRKGLLADWEGYCLSECDRAFHNVKNGDTSGGKRVV